MRILYIAALITITSLCMQEEPQPNQLLIACCDGTQKLTTKQWNLLFQHSKLLHHAAELHDEQNITFLPNITTSSLADILELLDDQGIYPIDNINRIDVLLQGASYLDLAPTKIVPLVVHLKHLISPVDIRNKQIKQILQSHYAWEHRKILNDPIPLTPCINTLEGHTDHINALVFYYDNHLASESADRTIKFWDHSSGQFLNTLSGHTSWINTLVLYKHNILASGSHDESIKLWDLVSGQCLKTLSDHTGVIRALVLCKLNILASGSDDKTIKLWALDSGKCINTLNGHSDAINTLVLCKPNTLASGSDDNTIKLWALDSGKCINTLNGHSDAINTLALCKPNILASGSDDKTIKLWALDSGKCINTLNGHTSWIKTLALCKNNILATGSYDKSIKLWDISALDLKKYTPPQNTLMQTLLNNRENVEILASILQDPDWKNVYRSLLEITRHQLEESIPLIQSMNLID